MFFFTFSGEKLTIKELSRMMKIMDEDSNGVISFDEFVKGVYDFVVSRKPIIDDNHKNVSQKSPSTTDSEGFIDSMEREGKEVEEEEKEEIPEDLSHLAPEEQQRRIKYRAAFMLGLGTLIVIIISDPMVSVLSEVGARTGISPFYISFIFAPLASNASEVISSFKYSLKKSSQSINISMAALEGINMTIFFCVFVLLFYFFILTL